MNFEVSRRKMVASQLRPNEVNDPAVIAAMGAVPRERFLNPAQRQFAYVDEDLPIGNGRFIMEPLVLARLLQLADTQPTDSALVIAAGAGYSTAVLARLTSSVVGIEADPSLVAQATRVLNELGVDNAAVVQGNMLQGAPSQGPFDVILFNGAIDEIPNTIRQQLTDGGRLVCVVRHGPTGRGTLVTRQGQAFGTRQEFDAATPLIPGFEKKAEFTL
jgi:protein-L-isoaspartate(D-aspartate) O-methyltransferase